MNEALVETPQTLEVRAAEVRARIESSSRAAGRAPDEVRLVAVTKTVPVPVIRAALAAGIEDFGENRVQEADAKIPEAGGGCWHLVGHLQRNKARRATELFDWIHSVDSARLASRLDQVRSDRSPRVLLQVNITGASAQHGVAPEALADLADAIDRETSLELRGLMTIGPLTSDGSAIRACFRRLRELRDVLRHRLPNQPFNELSMGMTDDLEPAIHEGATIVRVGRAIFGERPAQVPAERLIS